MKIFEIDVWFASHQEKYATKTYLSNEQRNRKGGMKPGLAFAKYCQNQYYDSCMSKLNNSLLFNLKSKSEQEDSLFMIYWVCLSRSQVRNIFIYFMHGKWFDSETNQSDTLSVVLGRNNRKWCYDGYLDDRVLDTRKIGWHAIK